MTTRLRGVTDDADEFTSSNSFTAPANYPLARRPSLFPEVHDGRMSEAESGRWGARRESWQRMLANAAAGATVVGVLWTFLGGGSNGPVVPSGAPGHR
jgi:hypothetical protein